MKARTLALLATGATLLAAACNQVKLSSAYQPPERVSATAQPGAVMFRWSAAPGASAYLVYLSTSSSDPLSASPVKVDATVQSFRASGSSAQPIAFAVVTQHDEPGGTKHEVSAASQVISGTALPLAFFSPAPDTLPSPPGTPGGSEFGLDVAIAGDVDGDGFGDAMVGGPMANSNNGLLEVFSGATQAPLFAVNGNADRVGEPLAGPGDAQGDGLDDVFFGALDTSKVTVAYDAIAGLQQGFATANPTFDLSALVVDVNRDGFADLLIGRPADNDAQGQVELRLGSSTGLPSLPTKTISSNTDPLGHALAVGDFDGDGKTDLLIGAWGAGPKKEGELCFTTNVLGATTTATCTLGLETNGYLGDAIADLGDLDHDGRDDALVLEYPGVTPRRVEIWRGASTPAGIAPTTWALTLGTDQQFQSGVPLHHMIAAAGDVDGDGLPDALIGDPGNGRVLLLLGSGGLLATSAVAELDDPSPGSGRHFGAAIAYGNLDGDAQPDLLVGVPGPGIAYLFHGLPTRGPIVDAGPTVTTTRANGLTPIVSAVDPVAAPGTPACSIDWGDQTQDAFACSDGPVGHTYAKVGDYHPTVTMTTADGRIGVSSTTVHVR